MRTLSIRVPYTPTRPGIDGPDGQPIGVVLIRLYPGADVDRYEDAAGAAEGDLAAALLLERQAQLAAAVCAPWVDATDRMRAEAIRDADLALSAVRWAGQAISSTVARRTGGNRSAETRIENGDDKLALAAPLFEAAKGKLIASGRKAPGARAIAERAWLDAGEGHPLREILTRHYAERWKSGI